MTGLIRGLVRHILRESANDVVDVEMRVRFSTSSSRTVADILTDMRGMLNVITVSQTGAMIDAEDGKSRLLLKVRFEDDENMSLEDLVNEIKTIAEVDLVTVTAYDGMPIRKIN